MLAILVSVHFEFSVVLFKACIRSYKVTMIIMIMHHAYGVQNDEHA